MNSRKPRAKKSSITCIICQQSFKANAAHSWINVRPEISALILQDHSDWTEGKGICKPHLSSYRRRYLEQSLLQNKESLTALDHEVLDSLVTKQLITQKTNESDSGTFGARMADRVASFGGSWTFILSFVAIIVVWMLLNVTGWLFKPYDQYPFILLNLVLSCLASLQAPIIMMSQRRQDEKDRIQAENEYRVNLKAELEIRQLHEKIDHQLNRQWDQMTKLYQVQMDILDDKHQ